MTDVLYAQAAIVWARRDGAGPEPHPCCSSSCLNLARFTVYWPGSTCVMCIGCKERATRIAPVMGFELQAKALDVPVGEDDTEIRGSLLELD